MAEDQKISKIKGDISSEILSFDNGMNVKIKYLHNKDSDESRLYGKFTAKYRKIQLIGKLGVLSEKIEENPYYDKNAEKLNDKWQKNDTNSFGDSLEIIHEGLTLDEIKQKVLNKESYLVIIWKKNNKPLPVDLGYHRDITLSIIDSSKTVAELTFNLINIVRVRKK